jgi:hypothetical protein
VVDLNCMMVDLDAGHTVRPAINFHRIHTASLTRQPTVETDELVFFGLCRSRCALFAQMGHELGPAFCPRSVLFRSGNSMSSWFRGSLASRFEGNAPIRAMTLLTRRHYSDVRPDERHVRFYQARPPRMMARSPLAGGSADA